MSLELYVVRHVATQALMPETKGMYSWWEPTEPELKSAPPRIFLTKRGAINAAVAWLQGNFVRNTSTDGDGWEGLNYTVISEPFPQAPKIPRTKGDLEVILAHLELQS